LELIYRERGRLPARVVLDALRANLGHDDHYVRQVVARLLESLPADERARLKLKPASAGEQTTFSIGTVGAEPACALARAAGLVADKSISADLRLANIRLVQLALGDIGANRV